MVKVKPLDVIKANYLQAAAFVPARYTRGIQGATWQAAAIAGEALYEAELQLVISQQRRAKGIQKSSDAVWQSASLGKGAQRIGPGITGAADKQATNFQPYAQALAALTLPAKTTDPLQNLTARGGAVVSTLVATKKTVKGY